jgi:hypothetical protein
MTHLKVVLVCQKCRNYFLVRRGCVIQIRQFSCFWIDVTRCVKLSGPLVAHDVTFCIRELPDAILLRVSQLSIMFCFMSANWCSLAVKMLLLAINFHVRCFPVRCSCFWVSVVEKRLDVHVWLCVLLFVCLCVHSFVIVVLRIWKREKYIQNRSWCNLLRIEL